MYLSKFLKYYNLSPQQLTQILEENDLDSNLRSITRVPPNWNEVVSQHTGISKMEEENVSHDSPGKNTNTTKEHEGDYKVQLAQARQRIKKENKDDYFIAYVKFVARDKSHGFVKRIDDINHISKINLRQNDSDDYSLGKAIRNVEKEQLIICAPVDHENKNTKRVKRARLISDCFTGTFTKASSGYKFTDWISLKEPFALARNFSYSNEKDAPQYASIKRHYSGYGSNYTIPEKDVNIDAIQRSIARQFKRSIKKEAFDELDKRTIEVYKWQVNESEIEEITVQQIKEDIHSGNCFATPEKTEESIEKWNTLCVGAFTFEMIRNEANTGTFIDFWQQGMLAFDFWGELLIEVLLKHFAENVLPDSLANLYKGVLSDDSLVLLRKALDGYFENERIIEKLIDYENLITIIAYLPEENRDDLLTLAQKSLSPKIKLEHWLKDKEAKFPHKEALRFIGSFGAKDQAEILKPLEESDLISVLPELKEIADEHQAKRLTLAISNYLIETFHPVCFDLEVDPVRKDILEVAFGNTSRWEECRTKSKIEETLSELRTLTANDNHLFIGHNCIEFDSPILEGYEVNIHPNKIWDTMLVEMFLSPDFKTFALRTSHHAIDDAQLTFQLFFNQLLRILKLDDEQFERVIVYFPTSLAEKIKTLRYSLALSWLSEALLRKDRDNFFRPQPQLNPIVAQLKNTLANFPERTRIIIGPELYTKDLFVVKDVSFVTEESDDDFTLVSEEKVERLADANNWSSIVLKRFIDDCALKQISPYWGNLAVSTKIRLARETRLEFILNEREQEPNWSITKTIFTTATQFKKHSERISQIEDLELFVLDPDLLSVSHKEKLKEIDLHRMLNNEEIDHLWMKFSGGQSIIGLSKEQVSKLVDKSQLNYSNYWLEKYQYGKFRIFGNHNWEEELKRFPADSCHYIKLDTEKFNKRQIHFSVVTSKTASSSKVVRYNPESIYRSRYWVYQKMLIQQIDSSELPIILLVQRDEEVQLLERYFNSLGYFIPNSDMPPGRRLELLHLNKAYKKMLIAPTRHIGKILHANYLGSLSVVLDSFHLAENNYMAKGTTLHNRMSTRSAGPKLHNDEDEMPSDVATNANLPLEKDSFFQLKLQLPYLNYLRTLLNVNDPDHKLWLLDPRIGDYPELSETWQVTKNYMSIWNDPDSYEKDAEEADKHIPSVRPSTNLPFDLEEIKKLLSNAFLGNGFHWYDYQEEYLDVIIPGKKDFLISLPTGGGKSLLFQAPSLFKSTFSNRLTLVITPLKALMEDQVKELWNKGFIGSVEYINSDRSSDQQLIYRSLAGGELSLLYVTPERFRSKGFLNALSMRLQSDGGLEYVVFDEAHCVSQWGHEFRPDYLNGARSIWNIKQKSEQKFPILLFSATVSEKVYQDFNLVFHD